MRNKNDREKKERSCYAPGATYFPRNTSFPTQKFKDTYICIYENISKRNYHISGEIFNFSMTHDLFSIKLSYILITDQSLHVYNQVTLFSIQLAKQ